VASENPSPWQPPAETPREFRALGLLLRPYEPTDAPALFAAVDSSRESLLPWLPWARSQNLTVEATAQSISSMRDAAQDPLRVDLNAIFGYCVGVFDASTGDLLGGTGLNRMLPAIHTAETGYWVRADQRRRGICTRALAGMLSWAFTPQNAGGFGFARVHIFAAEPNTASAGVPRRLGLRQCLHARRDRWVDGLGWCDTLGWDVLAEEWDRAAHRLRTRQT
jgi:ribosomal-protein-serine acetyltransferase